MSDELAVVAFILIERLSVKSGENRTLLQSDHQPGCIPESSRKMVINSLTAHR